MVGSSGSLGRCIEGNRWKMKRLRRVGGAGESGDLGWFRNRSLNFILAWFILRNCKLLFWFVVSHFTLYRNFCMTFTSNLTSTPHLKFSTSTSTIWTTSEPTSVCPGNYWARISCPSEIRMFYLLPRIDRGRLVVLVDRM